MLVGAAVDVRAAGLVEQPAPAYGHGVRRAPAPRVERQKRPANLVLFALRGLDRRIKRALLALATLATVSVTVLTLGYQEPDGTGMSVLDALYFTVETIGTVGFGDFYFRDQHAWLRGWAIFLMVVGATLATVFFALLTNVLISRTIASSLGRRRVTGLSGHVVVVGLGRRRPGRGRGRCAPRTSTWWWSRPTTRTASWPSCAPSRCHVVIADATLPDTWSAVGPRRGPRGRGDDQRRPGQHRDRAGGPRPAGRALVDVPVVLRLFDRRLAGTVSGSFDFRNVRSPSALAAPWFVGAALGMDVLQTLYVGGLPMLVARLLGGGVAGRARRCATSRPGCGWSAWPAATARVVNLPRRETAFAAGDVATLVGPYEELLLLLRR